MTGNSADSRKGKSPVVLGHCIAVFALILAIVGQIRDCHQDSRLEEGWRQTTAQQVRPLVKIIAPSEVEITDVFPAANQALSQKVVIADSAGKEWINVDCDVRISATVKFVNEGNAQAVLRGFIWSDTTSWRPALRRFMKGRPPDLSRFQGTAGDRSEELLQGDSMEFTFEEVVSFVDTAHTFTLHFLLLYENPLGMLYDTYLWAPYEYKYFRFSCGWRNGKTPGVLPYQRFTLDSLTESLQPRESANDSYHIYSEAEAATVRDLLDRVLKNASRI